MVSFETIRVGNKYSRPYLAELWGYRAHNAIGRGVVTPKNQRLIIFFVTKEKQSSLTQYEDRIDGDLLFWEGEKGHSSDTRIVDKTDDIHIFYRDRHHSDFTYEGKTIVNASGIVGARNGHAVGGTDTPAEPNPSVGGRRP